MAKQVTIITLGKLQKYDGLIKSYIGNQVSDGVKDSLKSVAIDGYTLKFYKEVKPAQDATPAFTIELPETDLSNLIEKIADAVAGDVVIAKADGTVADGGVKLTDLAKSADVTKEIGDAKTELDGKIKTNTDAIAKLNGAEDAEGSVAKAVKDASVALEAKIQAHKDAVDAKVTTLVGDDANKSVRAIANEELAAQLIPENAKESLNTLQEIAAWIQKHPDDATAMNNAITTLQTLVGTIPEGATATDIVNYIKELVDVEKTRATGIEGGLDTRLKAVEGLVGEGGSVDDKIAAAKADAIKDSKAYADSLAPNYATAAQGAKADTALQEADVADLRKDVAANKASLAEGGATANAIKEAKKAGDDAAAAVTTLENGQVATNKTDITAIKGRLDTIEGTEYVEATDEEIKALFTTTPEVAPEA